MIPIDTVIENISAKSCCSSPPIIFIKYPVMNPASADTQANATYLKEPRPVTAINTIEEIRYTANIEIAAPIVSYIGTKIKKKTKNVTISIIPVSASSLDFPKVLSFDIMFIVIDEGIIVIASTKSKSCPDSNSGPIKDKMDLGATSKSTTTGDTKLILNLRLSEDKSLLMVDEDGITIYAMLEAKLVTKTEIVKAI